MIALLQRFVAWLPAKLLAMAVRRWPTHLREIVEREWSAELEALASEPGVSRPVRAWRQWRFASSLAVARPPGTGPVLGGWMRWAARSWSQIIWLASAVLLTMLAAQVMLVPLQLIPFGFVTVTPTSAALLAVESYAVLAGVAMVIGTWLGRRRLRSRGGQPASASQSAWTALPLTGGLLLLDALARGVAQRWDSAWLGAVAALCLVFTLPPLAAGATALSARAGRHVARAGTAVVAPILTLAIMYVIGLAAGLVHDWPWRMLGRIAQEPMLPITYTGRGEEPPVETVLIVLPGFVFATIILTLAHAIRLAVPLPSAPILSAPSPAAPSVPVPTVLPPSAVVETATAATAATDVPAIARGPWWDRVLLGGAALSVMAWAVTLTYLTPNIGVQNSWSSRNADPSQLVPAQPAGWAEWTTEEGRMWMQELQLFAIVCAALCFLCAMAYRGRPVLPALGGSTVLIATTMTVVRAQWTTPRTLVFLALGGLLLGMAAWWASLRLAARQGWRHRPRRLVITVTVLAAVLIPGSFFPRIYALGKAVPLSLLLVAVGLPTILMTLIVMGMRATSPRPWRTPAWLLPAILGIAGILYYQDAFVPFLRPALEGPLAMVVFLLPLVLSVPARWRRPRRSPVARRPGDARGRSCSSYRHR